VKGGARKQEMRGDCNRQQTATDGRDDGGGIEEGRKVEMVEKKSVGRAWEGKASRG
jgi:hypothetical protein